MNIIFKGRGNPLGFIVRCPSGSTTYVPNRAMSLIEKYKKIRSPEVKKDDFKPIKFTRSAAYLDYKASDNFYGGDHRDLPKSHNLMLSATGICGFAYLIFLRDDIDNDGGRNLIRPVYETVPGLAIPLLQATIAENKRHGMSTIKLEKKLAEYMKEPEKYGMPKPKLEDN